MCSQFSVDVSSVDLYTLFQVTRDESQSDPEGNSRILPYKKAPIFFLYNNLKKLEWMQFSLIPSWSKEAKVKFATHNARLESVDEKPTFRVPFVKRHCIVPMTGFVEAIYSKSLAGNMVLFQPPELRVLYAAGIWDEWLNKETGELIRSFSILTADPISFVDETGHDRSPVFLNGEAAMKWLRSEGKPAAELKKFLLDSKIEPPLVATIDRPMRPGWKKRA